MGGSIVMTGGTAGFGALALKEAARNTDKTIFVGARNGSTLPPEIGSSATPVTLDLASFDSVKAFCETVKAHGSIGSLVMNAGLSPRKLETTIDGFDRAFQVNYLSHFLMYQLLLDQLSDDAMVLLTSSGTHDPDEKTPPPPPNHANARLLADPSKDPKKDRLGIRAATRSYTSSKLCCTMFSLTLAEMRTGGTSISFDPGLVPGTRLTREFPSWLSSIVIKLASRSMPADRTGSIDTSAAALADFMLKRSSVGANGDYVAMRGGKPLVVLPSQMAQDRELRATLWSESHSLLTKADLFN